MVLDELAGVDRPERRSRKIEIAHGRNRQPRLVQPFPTPLFAFAFDFVFFHLKQLLRTVLPSAEVILIKDDEIPVDLMHPLVRRLDAARLAIVAEEILKRPETDNGLLLVRLRILLVSGRIAGTLTAADELPALEVHMRHQILAPRRLDGRLECQHEDALRPEPFGELIGGEGLAEAHLRVPQELRRSPDALLHRRALVIANGLLDRGALLRTHLEVKRSLLDIVNAIADRDPRRANGAHAALEPLRLLALVVLLLIAHRHELLVDALIRERTAVRVHRAFGEDDPVRLLVARL